MSSNQGNSNEARSFRGPDLNQNATTLARKTMIPQPI